MGGKLIRWYRNVIYFNMTYFWQRRKKTIVLALLLLPLIYLFIQYNNISSTKKLDNKILKIHDDVDRIHSIVDLRNADKRIAPDSFDRDQNAIPKNIGIQSDQKIDIKKVDILNEFNHPPFIPAFRYVHLDLKGAPPKLSYLQQIFPLLTNAGANGILLEYEDMFPFWGSLKPAAAGNAYSLKDIKAILDLAKSHNLEVIPLVQTFGHLEMFLKLPEFRNLREVDEFPQAICPSKNDSFTLVQQIIDQVMTMHPTTKWLHIGCDEVYHIGYCEKCRMKSRDDLFLNHVSRVAKYVRDKYNVIPIIWDDMLRQFPNGKINEYRLGELGVEIMLWNYIKDIYRFIPYTQFISFSEIFKNIWGASAFKGAFGETLTAPNVLWHLENNEAWLQALSEQHKYFKSVRGIVITGWQRYDHFASLCELFPTALPSLIVNLLTISHGKFDSKIVFEKFDKIMGCTSPNSNVNNFYSSNSNDVDFTNDPHLFNRCANCQFPGSRVFRMVEQHTEIIKRVNDYIYDVTIHKAWLTDYNIRHNFSSPYRVDEALQEFSTVYYALHSLLMKAKDALSEIYDDYTVSEWIEQNIYPYLLKMDNLMKNSHNLKKATTWPRRPFSPLKDLKRFEDSNVIYGR